MLPAEPRGAARGCARPARGGAERSRAEETGPGQPPPRRAAPLPAGSQLTSAPAPRGSGSGAGPAAARAAAWRFSPAAPFGSGLSGFGGGGGGVFLP